MTPIALTIAGSDPSGGAGLQADLKTFHQHQVFGASIVTLLTVQNTQTVSAVEYVQSDFVVAQLDSVLDDFIPNACKTGALGNAEIIHAVAERATKFSFPLIVDPVMISKHGHTLIDEEAVDVLATKLLPNAYLVTPNRHEAELLSGIKIRDLPSAKQAALAIRELGARNVLIKGKESDGRVADLLVTDSEFTPLESNYIETNNTHGTGCVLSAAITAMIAKGEDLPKAVAHAKTFVHTAICNSPNIGKGCGPLKLYSDR